jgi:small-conductance mechanosensitive channel
MEFSRLADKEFVLEKVNLVTTWFSDVVFTMDTMSEIVIVASVCCFAVFLSRRLAPVFVSLHKKNSLFGFFEKNLFSVVWIVLLWGAIGLYVALGQPFQFVKLAVSLLSAWVLIDGFTLLVKDPVLSRMISVTIWIIAALNIVGWLDETIIFLGDLGFSIGDIRVSALSIVKGLLALAFLLWFASLSSKAVEKRISRLPNLTPSTRVLFSKIVRMSLFIVAFVIALNTIGIDLTAFAVFSGALGVGIGFGLQKVVSNFVSGIILLVERSVKPGDVIAVGTTYGWVQSLGACYVSVLTRDGTEHLIPNEEFITQKVENWSYSSNLVRIKVPLGVSYNTDLDHARALCLEATKEAVRVQPNPTPACLIMGFGDNSVDLEVRFWINDPRDGVTNIMSEVYAVIWRKFQENNIEIPFPQRDLHIRSAEPLTVKTPPASRSKSSSAKKTAAKKKA